MTLFLCAAVTVLIFLNGATDASNAIASAVASGAVRMRQAVILSAAGNVMGGVLSGVLFSRVGQSVADTAQFGVFGAEGVLCSVTAAAIFTAAAWLLRLPTSESHALLSAVAGVSAAFGGGALLSSVVPVVLWMTLSAAGGFLLGLLAPLLIKERGTEGSVRRMQILSAMLSSFFHGAQDLPKFLALLFASAAADSGSRPLLWVLAALVMGIGTLAGGRRMTDAVGTELAFLTRRAALSSDFAAAGALCLLSIAGVPASTTHAKTAAVAGAALTSRGCRLCVSQLCRFLLAWMLTFPLAAVLGYGCARISLAIL